MDKLHTHYDNLKVSRDAPAGVIKAAYKALAQENHPDRCSDPKAARRMQIINDAYAVLSDAGQRQAHDKWIVAQEKAAAQPRTNKKGTLVTHPAIDAEYVESLHNAYRHKIRVERDIHAHTLAAATRTKKFERWIGMMTGLIVSVPLYIIYASIDTAINHAH
jgi:curved DNA-binding protein CbpA